MTTVYLTLVSKRSVSNGCSRDHFTTLTNGDLFQSLYFALIRIRRMTRPANSSGVA